MRAAIPGVFPDLLAAGCDLVLVTQLAPGLRARQPLRPPLPGEEMGWLSFDSDGRVS